MKKDSFDFWVDWLPGPLTIIVSVIIILFLIFSRFAFAAPVNITCDPQANVDEYNLFVNGNQVATSTAIVDIESGLYYLLFDLKTLNLVDGNHIATATAVNRWGESALSNECPFTKVIPANPQNLRIPVSGE